MSTSKSVLFVHQSADMYGSDRVLLSTVLGVMRGGFYPIVILPEHGPLETALLAERVETHICSVAKVNRATLSFKGLLKLPLNLFISIKAIDKVLAGRKVSLVYSNTLAVLGAGVWAKLHKIPHLWHVHELLENPKIVRKGFPKLLNFFADKVVCNSSMTREWVIREQPLLVERSRVIWNGLGERPRIMMDSARELRNQIGLKDGQLLVLLAGRINRMKGQNLLIEAASILWDQGFHNVHYLILGSPVPGMEHFVDRLRQNIDISPVSHMIHIMDFKNDIWPAWDASDIAVIPSTEPESFGMVAIEAMAAARPVVAAAHGGILDIIEDGVSGILFEPGNQLAFAEALKKLIISTELRKQLGLEGQIRQVKIFSLEAQIKSTLNVINDMTEAVI